MEKAQPRDETAAIHFRAEELARRTVEYHRVHEAEHRSRERFGRRFTPFPWAQAVGAVLVDESLEDEDSVVALIRELGRQGCSEVALAALDLVLTRGSPAPTKPMFDAVIRVCATEYQDQRCLDQFGRMRSLGLTPDLGTANLVLTGLCCRGRLEAAVELLAEMRNGAGIRPNSYSVLMILQACNYKRRGAYRQAIDAVQALEAGGRTANEEVIEALLQVCEAAMRRAPSFEAALAVFSALSELHLADSTRVYNGLLGAAGRAGRWREAQALFGQMCEDDIPASLETHTALIQACVVGRALDHALHIFEALVAGRSAHEAVPASIATYNHLIHACHQAGMLEKALEIAAWVQKTGVEFDDDTYGELMATIDVAQLWDDKAMKQARQQHKVVVPRSLRPAPYDAMRVMYLDHLESLQQEELLALEKLGGLGSWAPKSLTRGSLPSGPGGGGGGMGSWPVGRASPSTPVFSSVTSSARSLAANGYDAEANGYGYGYGYGGRPAAPPPVYAWQQPAGPGHGLAAPGTAPTGAWLPPAAATAAERSAASSRSVSPSPMAMAAAAGGGLHHGAHHAGSNGRPASQPQPNSHSHPHSRAASVNQLLKTLSSRPLPPVLLGGGPPGPVGGMSFKGPAATSAAAAAPPAAPTGFHEPPTWAQVQTLDAATAGPGGTPFSTAVATMASASVGDGANGVDGLPLTLTLAVEPANLLYGQSSTASLSGVGTSRTSLRSIAAGHGGGGSGGLRVVVAPSAAVGGVLPPLLGEASSPHPSPLGTPAAASVSQSLVFGAPNNPRTFAAAAPPPGRQRFRAAWGPHPPQSGGGGGGPDGGGGLAADFAPSQNPLPALSSVPMSVSIPTGSASTSTTSCRYSMAAVVGR